MNEHPNDDLHGLLHDAVDDVEPRHGIDAIRERATLDTPRRPRRWWPVTVAAAAAVALVIGSTMWLINSDGPNSNAGTAATPPTAGRTVEVPVYYVGDVAVGPRLFLQPTTLQNVTTSDVEAAVEEAVSGTPADPDQRSGFPDGTTAHTTMNGDRVEVDLRGTDLGQLPSGLTPEDADMAVQAVLWTVQETTGAPTKVVFTLDGTPTDTVLGVDVAQLSRGTADNVLAPVSISTPAEGEQVSGTFTVTGQAATFEANVVWELIQGGQVIDKGFTTAAECCTLSPFEFTVTAPPGQYTLMVHDTDESDGEGHGINEDTRTIIVR